MGLLYGLLSAIGYGGGDFLARFPARRIGAVSTLFLMQFVGLIVLGVYLIASGELARMWAATEIGVWIAAVIVAVFNITGAVTVYQALAVGKASIVSPIVSAYSALIVVIAFFSGERLLPQQTLGLALVIVGVILSSIERASGITVAGGRAVSGSRLQLPAGVLWAGLSAVAFAIAFSAYGFVVTPTLGGIIPVWISRITCIVVLGTAFLILRRGFRPPQDGTTWLYVFGVGVLDTIGFVALAVGVSGDQVGLVSVLSSLFAAVTVLLARIFLREQLQPIQWAGIGLIFAGLVLVTAAS